MLRFERLLRTRSAFWVLAVLTLGSPVAAQTITGVNLNKRTEEVHLQDYERLHIRWFRTYILMLPYIDAKARGDSYFQNSIHSQRLTDLKKLQDAGMKTVLTFRWDFKTHTTDGLTIPSPGSRREKQYFDAALEVYDLVGRKSEVVVVGNEPMYETLESDLVNQVESSGESINPAAQFYRRLALVIHERMLELKHRNRKSIYLGSLNDLDNPEIEALDFVKRTFYNAKKLSYIDGIDIHTHARNMVEFERALSNARTVYGYSGNLISTEYSIVFAFRRHFFDSTCAGSKGRSFCDRYKISSSTRELDFINHAIMRPAGQKISPQMWADFFISRSYLPDSFLLEANKLFNKYGVKLVTFAAKAPRESIYEPGSGNNANPWVMNGILSPTVLDPNHDGSFRLNFYYSRDFPRRIDEKGKLHTGW